jgi:hypothetical protein
MWVRTRPPDPTGPSAYPKTCNDSLAPKKEGTYTIAVDPDGLGSIPAQTVTCQKETVLSTDRYWTLVGNYVHLGGTTPGYFVRTTFPVQKASGYGTDESAFKGPSEAWGHLHAHSLALLQPTELRFECKTSNHNRVVDFATKNAGCLTYAMTGIGSCYVAGPETRVLATSAGNPFLPTGATESWHHDFVILGYEPSLAFQTFFKGSTPQARWNIGTWAAQRWECDDAPENSAASTVHRIWILGPP